MAVKGLKGRAFLAGALDEMLLLIDELKTAEGNLP
jgi:hypothetical protein